MENIKFLSYKPLQNSNGSPSLLSVANIAYLENDLFHFVGKHGLRVKTKEEINKDNWNVVELSEIDIKGSLWKWFKTNQSVSDYELKFNPNLDKDNSILYNDNGFFKIPILLRVNNNKLEFKLEYSDLLEYLK